MTAMKTFGAILILGYLTACSVAVDGQQADGPRYTKGNNLLRPTDYREWPFIGSGLGLTYEDENGTAPPLFTNAFVNPSSYRYFMQTGTWPNGTTIMLEFRGSEVEAQPNRTGRFQGPLQLLEAEVKDSRFPDGWAFFNFGTGTALAEVAAPLSGSAVAPCVECHTRNAAVERTFVQFYPTLLEVARQKGTLKPGFQ